MDSLECTVAEKKESFMARNHKNDKRAHLKERKSFLSRNGIVIERISRALANPSSNMYVSSMTNCFS